MEIKATGLPETIEDYQVALNAAFAGGKAYGLSQRTWVELTNNEIESAYWKYMEVATQNGFEKVIKKLISKLKEKNT